MLQEAEAQDGRQWVRDPEAQTSISQSWLYRKVRKLSEFANLSKSRRNALVESLLRMSRRQIPTVLADVVPYEHLMKELVSGAQALIAAKAPSKHVLLPASSWNQLAFRIVKAYLKIGAGVFKPKKCSGSTAKLFMLFPVYSFQQRFVEMDNRCLHYLLRKAHCKGMGPVNTFKTKRAASFLWTVFDMKRVGIHSEQDLFKRSKKFNVVIRTDGVALDYLFVRPAQPELAKVTPASLGHLPGDEVWPIDPGVTDLFMAVSEDKQIRKMSTKEWHALCGFGRHKQLRRKWKLQEAKEAAQEPRLSIQQIEDLIPSPKTANVSTFKRHIEHVLKHWKSLTDFYDARFRGLLFDAYKGRQRMLEEAVRIFTGGSHKYHDVPCTQRQVPPRADPRRIEPLPDPDRRKLRAFGPAQAPPVPKAGKWRKKPPDKQPPLGRVVVAFGDGAFSPSMPGKLPVATRRLLKHMRHVSRRIGRDKFVVCMIDEYLTSQVCSRCQLRTLENRYRLHAVRACKTCDMVWNRDVNASRNIGQIFRHARDHGNERLQPFRRPESIAAIAPDLTDK